MDKGLETSPLPTALSKGRWHHLYAVLGLVLLAAIYTWPLLSRLTTSIPATPEFEDVTEYVWNIRWVAQALTTEKQLLYSDALFVPSGVDLRFGTFGLLQGLLAFPFTSLLGVVGAFNLILFATLVFNGWAGYALAYHFTKRPPASFLAAALFMLNGAILAHLTLGRYSLSSLWLVAGALLFLDKTVEQPNKKTALLLAAFVTAALLTDFQILLFSLLWIMVYGFGRLLKDRAALFSRARMLALGLSIALPALVFLLLYAPAFTQTALREYPQPGLEDVAFYSNTWSDFFTPDSATYIFGLELGILASASLVVFRGKGESGFWLAGVGFFLLLTLGPYLKPTEIPLPFIALTHFEPLRQFRTPYRLGMPAQIGLMMVAALVLARWLPRLGRWGWPLAAGVAVLHLLAITALLPFPVQTYPDYDFYHQISAEPGEFTLLEVPFGVRSGLQRIGSGGEVVQYYQHIHGKRLLSGSVARLPSSVFDFYRSHPALVFLSGEQTEFDQALLGLDFADILGWSNTRYVLLHRELLTPERAGALETFLDSQPGLERVGNENDLVIYRVISPK